MQEQKTYLGNPLLKSAYVPQDFSEEQVGEYVRCQQDPLHFVNEHVKIVSVDVVDVGPGWRTRRRGRQCRRRQLS